MPAVPPYIIEPVWEQFSALLPEHQTSHPLGCHRPRIPDRAYDSKKSRHLLEERGLIGVINEKGRPAPLTAGLRWIVQRTDSSWHNAHKKLVWCTEREDALIDFWISFSNVVIVVRRLIREAWRRYRWEGRPVRCP